MPFKKNNVFFFYAAPEDLKQIPFHLYLSTLHTVRMHVMRRHDKATETGQQ